MERLTERLIQKYTATGPRYTSYPTAPTWQEIDSEKQLEFYQSLASSDKPLSLYFHIPFCEKRCLFCGCNTLITKNHSLARSYVEYILMELEKATTFGLSHKKVCQLHFGGGTPNYLIDKDLTALVEKSKELFEFQEDAEIAMEIDPCVLRPGQLEMMSELGFNRISFGVQDFDPVVQASINRIQSVEITQKTTLEARQLGFGGINFDLIYGLPHQTLKTFQNTLKQVLELRPDRVALYNFAYLPDRLQHQKQMDPKTFPNEAEKLEIFFHALENFTNRGYRFIGMDHFALEEDELSVAQKHKCLYRNFMGYSPKSGVDILGLGVSSIGEGDEYFIQNEKRFQPYQNMIGEKGLAGVKGIKLSPDDRFRKGTILRLMCNFSLEYQEFEQAFGIDPREYFQTEIASLEDLQADQLLEVNDYGIEVKDQGKLVIRNICMRFDRYLQDSKQKTQFSKTL